MERAEELIRILGWLVFSFFLTLNAWIGPDPTVIGNWAGPDMAGTAWTWWWTAEALASGQLPWESQQIFYPIGLYPIAQLNLVDALIAAPLFWSFEPVTAYKLTVVLMLASTAWAGERLCRWEGADRLSSIFGGIAIATSPYLAMEIWTGRLSQVWLMPLILSIGLWRKLLTDRLSRVGALGAGLMSGVCFLSYWYYGFFGALAVILMVVFCWKNWSRERWVQLGIATAGCTLLILPAVWILVGPQADLPGMDTALSPSGETVSGREASRLWASDFSLWPWWIVGGGWSPESDISLGWTWLLVGLAPLVSTWRSRGVWIGVALMGIVLTLGPTLRGPIGQEWSSLPLPFAWLQDFVPFFYRMRWPYRAASIVLPALAVIAALNLTELARELPRRRWILSLLAITGLSWEVDLFQGSGVAKTSEYETPGPAYAGLDGPVLLLPLRGDDDSVRMALWMQIWHGQPISYGLGGHLEGHRPVAWDEWLESNPFLVILSAYENWSIDRVEIQPEDIQALLDQGFRYALVDSRHFRSSTDTMMMHLYSRVLTATFGEPIAEDDQARIWRIQPIDEPIILDPAPGSD
jgi:hypothetical protein